jgi:signal transduction histidine kinase
MHFFLSHPDIFHEVRVPFNAIVLGLEQLRNDLSTNPPHLHDALETIGILNEQSGVVTHILNDVMALQRIEGQLAGTLFACQSYPLSHSSFSQAFC